LDLTLSSLIQKYLAKDTKDPIKEEAGEAKIEDKTPEEELVLASGSKV
jgi:hypothetical protein